MAFETTDVAMLVRILLVAAVALLAYKHLYLEREKPSIKKDIPGMRGRPLVVTKVGIVTPKRTIPLAPNKYQVEYDHPDGYSPVYYKTPYRDDLVAIDDHQQIFGTTRPVYIEMDLICKLAYGVEDDMTRQLMKGHLGKIVNTLANKQLGKDKIDTYLKQVDAITNKLSEEPNLLLQRKKDYEQTEDAKIRTESQLLTERAGTEGRLERRLDPIVAIAARRAKPTED